MKKKYDLVIPLGNACSCSMTLREAGLQLLSLPFDWIGPGSIDSQVPLDMGIRVRAICDGFSGWMNAGDFERFADSGDKATKEFYRDNRTGFLFLHDFPKNVPFETAFPAVASKYQRRFNRLLQLITNAQRILLFRLDRPDAGIQTPIAACQEAIRLLRERFPEKAFDLILMQQDGAIPFAQRIVTEIEPGLTSIRFDYHQAASADLPSAVKLKQTATALKSLCSVRDYRTADERRKMRKARLRKLFDKLMRSFAKRLGRGMRANHE